MILSIITRGRKLKAADLKGLKGAEVSAYLIVIKDHYERNQCVDQLTHQLLPERSEFSVTRFDGSALKAGTLSDELHSSSFLADRKVFVVRQADKLKKEVLSEIEAYLESPTDGYFLILEGESFDARTSFYKKIDKLGAICHTPEAKPNQKEGSVAIKLADWAAGEGKVLDAQTAKLMVQQLGTDQELLRNELDKLICYVGERERVSAEDVRAVCSFIPQESIWQLGDAIFRRDVASALKMAHSLLREGVAVFALSRQIRTQFQTKFQICSLLASGGGPAEVQKQFPYMRGYVLDSNLSLAQSYGFEACKKGLMIIDTMELQAKNSLIPHELLIEMMITKLTVKQ